MTNVLFYLQMKAWWVCTFIQWCAHSDTVEMVASVRSIYTCWVLLFHLDGTLGHFCERIAGMNAPPFSWYLVQLVKCMRILRLKWSPTSSHRILKQLNYTGDEKGVLEKQEAVMLADGQSNGLMGMLNEWGILQGSPQLLVEFWIESVNQLLLLWKWRAKVSWNPAK